MKSKVQKIVVTVSSFATVVNASQPASAQLNVGHYGIQQGLEQNYLQYQVSGRDLSQMRGIPACSVGFGASCNKAGAVFQKILESNGGPTYEQLLMKAAGGEENFRNFASFYGNNPNLAQIPYASFWENNNPDIVDGYRYLLGQTVSQTPQEGLGQVTKNFDWAPEAGGNSLDPRNALLDLKYSYGRLLLREIAKIPDAQQQIQAMGLKPEEAKFFLEKLSAAKLALNGNEQSLKETILKELSVPYSPDGGDFNRPNLGVPPLSDGFTDQPETLAGELFSWEPLVSLAPEEMNVDLPSSLAEVDFPGNIAEDVALQQGSGSSFPSWLIGAGVLPLLLLLLSFGGGDSSGHGGRSIAATPPVGGSSSSGGGGSVPPIGNGGPPGENQIIEVPSHHPVIVPGQEVKKVPEPTTITPLVLMIIFIYMVTLKHWRTQTKG
ncbi:hypothetical protein SAMD00079811_50920 [Scytonema sp. HK-05]|uniref:hypothetical protein n=1 Tax=Scytonema sp. HK-05 TaxID=1137095 RepID=UPI00093651FF|nr:hypothetical protein [Scytonema sp. HK-05]OKH58041.1 hypothetical protein NIES2130_16645 [Scytonema sp. HK-05]BAY47474.1 hypothetical protein SAMD00079811_50920 [Scytonema sp. HK-05]